ncbi:conjugative transposon protein TraJ [Pedobacter sp. Du54]|uniref:conjugative transposon protein TraJ n=1 Tax=Pedobacter anseongensis TaxID=3133439 RepID=UPI0030ADAE0A
MQKRLFLTAFLAVIAMLLPEFSHAQGMAQSLNGMQPVLDKVYSEMLPLCSRLIDVARGIAGFGALWYIASRVWRQIASAEPIDVYPLLRPFALGLAILLFPMVIAIMNGILQPTVSATGAMVSDSNKAIERLLKAKEAAIKKSDHWQMYVGDNGNGNKEKWLKYTYPEEESEGFFEGIGHDMQFFMEKQYYNFRNSIKEWLSQVLEVLYAAASLCINTVRTFFLIVLAILGPLVFGFAVFDGFQNSLVQWLARYVNIFLWLPIANIFGSILGKIQENMLKLDISQIDQQGDTFFSQNDVAYLVFLVIGIVGYAAVPSIANYVVHAHGNNSVLQKVTNMVSSGAGAGGAVASAGGARAVQGAGNILSAGRHINEGLSGKAEGAGTHGAVGRALGKSGSHMRDRLSGH